MTDTKYIVTFDNVNTFGDAVRREIVCDTREKAERAPLQYDAVIKESIKIRAAN